MERIESHAVEPLNVIGPKQEMDLSFAKTEESGVFSASNCSSLGDTKSLGSEKWEFATGEVTDPLVFNPPVDVSNCLIDGPSFLCNISTIMHNSDHSDKCKD